MTPQVRLSVLEDVTQMTYLRVAKKHGLTRNTVAGIVFRAKQLVDVQNRRIEMKMSVTSLNALDNIIDRYNSGVSAEAIAKEYKVGIGDIRGVVRVARQTGTEIIRHGGHNGLTVEEKSILATAMRSAQAQIAKLRSNGHAA